MADYALVEGLFGHRVNVSSRLIRPMKTPCWEWQLSKVDGYGQTWVDGKRWLVHRLVWTILVGEIPADMTLDHWCRNHACCNPGHLEVVTRGENVLRGISPAATNKRKTRCSRGHQRWSVQGDGKRRCLICSRLRDQRRAEQRAAQYQAKKLLRQ